MSHKPNHDAKNIGARFRSARSLVPNLNRKLFCERYGINRYTMQSWENGLHVSKGKNVEKFIESLAREEVFCTSEWLIDGTGEPARPLAGANSAATATSNESLDANIPGEKFDRIITRLYEAHRDLEEELVTCTINDGAMAPKFLMGDTVLGVSRERDKVQLHQKYCIVELTPHRSIVRKILVIKDGLLLVALDDRIPLMTLSLTTRIHEIVWHLVKQ